MFLLVSQVLLSRFTFHFLNESVGLIQTWYYFFSPLTFFKPEIRLVRAALVSHSNQRPCSRVLPLRSIFIFLTECLSLEISIHWLPLFPSSVPLPTLPLCPLLTRPCACFMKSDGTLRTVAIMKEKRLGFRRNCQKTFNGSLPL